MLTLTDMCPSFPSLAPSPSPPSSLAPPPLSRPRSHPLRAPSLPDSPSRSLSHPLYTPWLAPSLSHSRMLPLSRTLACSLLCLFTHPLWHLLARSGFLSHLLISFAPLPHSLALALMWHLDKTMRSFRGLSAYRSITLVTRPKRSLPPPMASPSPCQRRLTSQCDTRQQT